MHLVLGQLGCLEISEDEDEDKQVVHGQALLNQVSRKKLLCLRASLDNPDTKAKQHCSSHPEGDSLSLLFWPSNLLTFTRADSETLASAVNRCWVVKWMWDV